MASCRGLAVIVVVLSSCLADPECYMDNKLLNKALGKTTFASNETLASSLTVDGDHSQYDAMCLNTLTVDNPWLVVDLNETLSVSTVVFMAITAVGATTEYQVLVFDTFDAATFDPLTSGYEPCVSHAVRMVEFEVMYLQCERTLVGRYLLIFRQEVANLQVCEVEVYAEQVFQPEKWTCVRPELQGPTGLLNLGQGRGPNSTQISQSDEAYRALDGIDNGVWRRGIPYYPCTHTSGEPQPWWLVDLGQRAVITALIITNRVDCCQTKLSNFKIFVGYLVAPATTFVESDYELCAYYCTAAPRGRSYYKCGRPIEGNHVAIAHLTTTVTVSTLCEVEIYADVNDITLPSWPANNGVNQKILYDDDDSTCIQLHQLLGFRPFSVQVPWDPTAKTGINSRTGYYHCRQHFYVNVTFTTGLHLGVSVSDHEIEETAPGEYTYVSKYSEVIGKMQHEGLTSIRYACFCEVKCWVYIYVKHPHTMKTSDSRLCTINVYD